MQDPTLKSPSVRFLTQGECAALASRAASFAVGGGRTGLAVESTWTGSLRWGRDQVTHSGDVRDDDVTVWRDIRGASATMRLNQIEETRLHAAIRRAERVLKLEREVPESELRESYLEPYLAPRIWSDKTYDLDAESRAEAMRALVQPAVRAGMRSAGYIQVAAHGRAAMEPASNRSLYYPYTTAQYSVTVRDPNGTASGWAGVDFSDWGRIDTGKLANIALEKCLRSRNPVAAEPGRYTVVLEPQAVCDFVELLLAPFVLDRPTAEQGGGPFARGSGTSKIGQRILDERISISHDPMDPDLGFPPFASLDEVYHPVTWIERGVLKELAYRRDYAIQRLGTNQGLPSSGAFRMSGGTSTVAEMIATTQRGLLVTRFANVQLIDVNTLLTTGYTRDGLWLIEDGKLSKPVKNFRFVDSPLFALNSVEQLGVPQRVFHPDAPVVVPALKIRDFGFTSLADA